MKKDDKGLTGAEWFFVLFIALLLILTVVFAVLIGRIGPEKEPNFMIQSVYYMENENGLDVFVYISNVGEPAGYGHLDWMVTRPGDRLVAEGQEDINIKGRTTDIIQFRFEYEGSETHSIEIDIYQDGERVDYYRRSLTP